MSDFYDTDGGFSDATQEELDDIALHNGGIMGSTGFGYAKPKSTTIPNHGYITRVINTQGMGNHGSIVLIGVTPRTRELLRQGEIALNMRTFNIDYVVSEALTVAAVMTKYGHEYGVLKLALEHWDAPWEYSPMLGEYPNYTTSIREWFNNFAPSEGLSALRLESAAEIALRFQRNLIALMSEEERNAFHELKKEERIKADAFSKNNAYIGKKFTRKKSIMHECFIAWQADNKSHHAKTSISEVLGEVR